jgi:hypothetical protein
MGAEMETAWPIFRYFEEAFAGSSRPLNPVATMPA